MMEPAAAMGFACAAHRHRGLVPLEVHHIWPKGKGGPDTPDNLVSLCANAHGAVHDLLSKMLKAEGGKLPWSVRIKYGHGVRRIASQGYRAIIEGAPS